MPLFRSQCRTVVGDGGAGNKYVALVQLCQSRLQHILGAYYIYPPYMIRCGEVYRAAAGSAVRVRLPLSGEEER